ncbi:hypothetical protein P3383_17395 [Vibrio parahaemolyticus]|nr:hypothetical protein [Vibrio parahaemolyticus]MDF4334962.1 hypothetical protein [Vibrio parahaemolyticus]
MNWSFCIVAGSGSEDKLNILISSIQREFINTESFCDIVIVGNVKEDLLSDNIRVYKPKERFFRPDFSFKNMKQAIKMKRPQRLIFKYGPISYKKNYAVKMAKFENVVVMHDYIVLEKGWLSGFLLHGGDWNVCMNVVKNKDGSRYRDWCTWDFPGVGPALLPYDKYVKEMYISGTYFCVKKSFYLENPLDEKLFWGEGEDVEWSIRVRDKTTFSMNPHSTISFSKLKPLDESPYDDIWVSNTNMLKKILNEVSENGD